MSQCDRSDTSETREFYVEGVSLVIVFVTVVVDAGRVAVVVAAVTLKQPQRDEMVALGFPLKGLGVGEVSLLAKEVPRSTLLLLLA